QQRTLGKADLAAISDQQVQRERADRGNGDRINKECHEAAKREGARRTDQCHKNYNQDVTTAHRSDPFGSALTKNSLWSNQQHEHQESVRDNLLQSTDRIDVGVGSEEFFERWSQQTIGKGFKHTEENSRYESTTKAGQPTEHDHRKRNQSDRFQPKR